MKSGLYESNFDHFIPSKEIDVKKEMVLTKYSIKVLNLPRFTKAGPIAQLVRAPDS